MSVHNKIQYGIPEGTILGPHFVILYYIIDIKHIYIYTSY